jgi:uncharacterized DUF497 family protein
VDESREFEWDKHNQRHLARHGISQSEAEDVLSGNHVLLEDEIVGDEQRWIAIGSTRAGRILTVVFAVRNEAMRPITGWVADKEACALYFREWGPV